MPYCAFQGPVPGLPKRVPQYACRPVTMHLCAFRGSLRPVAFLYLSAFQSSMATLPPQQHLCSAGASLRPMPVRLKDSGRISEPH